MCGMTHHNVTDFKIKQTYLLTIKTTQCSHKINVRKLNVSVELERAHSRKHETLRPLSNFQQRTACLVKAAKPFNCELNGKWLPDFIERLKASAWHQLYLPLLPFTHARSESINADSLKLLLLTARKNEW